MSGDLLARVHDEIDARLRDLRPAVSEYQQLLAAAEDLGLPAGRARARSPRRAPVRARAKPGRAARGAAAQAIVAALEHGSHTVGELSVVTAMSAANIRANLRRLQAAGTVTRATREGKAAYALAAPPGSASPWATGSCASATSAAAAAPRNGVKSM